MLSISQNYVKETIISSIINIIIANKSLYIYSSNKFYIALKNNYKTQEALVKISVYIIGEIGEFLLKNSITDGDGNIINVTENDLIDLYRNLLAQKYSETSVKEFILNSILKLSNKILVTKTAKENLCELNDSQKFEFDYEIQQRACEYNLFNIFVNEEVRCKILAAVPLYKTYKDNEVKK